MRAVAGCRVCLECKCADPLQRERCIEAAKVEIKRIFGERAETLDRLLEVEGEDADRIQVFQSEVGFGLSNLKKEQIKRGNVSHRFGRRTWTPHAQTLRFTLKNTEGVTY